MWISSLEWMGPEGARLPAVPVRLAGAADGFGRAGWVGRGPTGPQNGMKKALQVPDLYGISFPLSFGSYKDMG